MIDKKKINAAALVLFASLLLAGVGTAGVIDYYYHRYFASAADKCFYHKLDAAQTGGTWTKCSDFTAATLGSVAADTQFDITRMSATRCRYTWDTTGTDPGISSLVPGAATVTVDMGTLIVLAADNFSAGNNGTFEVTSSGANFFETYNTNCYTEGNKTVGATGAITYRRAYTSIGASSSQFDITDPGSDQCTYTWDGTGTDPGINPNSVKVGDQLYLNGQNFNASNKLSASVVSVTTNAITVGNASCVAETNKTLGSGYIYNYGR